MDINETINSPNLINLINYAASSKVPLIIGSDTNSHHKLWGNKDCNKRGEELLDLINAHGLSWTNKGSTPTFINSRGHESIIDLTITNDKGSELISNWQVSPKFSNSDHCYIMFDILSTETRTPKQIRIVKNTDWELFQKYLDENIGELPTVSTDCDIGELDIACRQLIQHLTNAFEAACPVTYISSSIKKPPWMTPAVINAQRNMRNKLKLARASKHVDHWKALRDANKTYNKLLNKTHKDEWRSFCKDTDSVRESARMNKILKSCSGKKDKLEAIRKTDKTLTANPDDTLKEMIRAHFKSDPLSNTSNTPDTTKVDRSIVERIYNHLALKRPSSLWTLISLQGLTTSNQSLCKNHGITSKMWFVTS